MELFSINNVDYAQGCLHNLCAMIWDEFGVIWKSKTTTNLRNSRQPLADIIWETFSFDWSIKHLRKTGLLHKGEWKA